MAFRKNQVVKASKAATIPARYQGRRGVVVATRKRGKGVAYEVAFPQRATTLTVASRFLTAA